MIYFLDTFICVPASAVSGSKHGKCLVYIHEVLLSSVHSQKLGELPLQ